jgi:phosphatidylglycerol lysyltransferase
VRQGHLSIMESRLGAAWITGRTGHALIGMFDPIGTHQPQRAALRALAHHAASEGRVAAIYKCSARTAATARGIGWQAMALGPEAVVSPARFSLMGPQLSALRRKLRKAEASGVTLHLGDMHGAAERAALARLWARARNGERGFSMGRYAESYLSGQLVIEARQLGRMVAFATFHQGTQEWTLDLMRALPDAPDGAMQAIVTHAILLAQAAGVPRLSLAAAGAPPALPPLLCRWCKADETGLHRFKQMFAPVWHPLYIVAPSRTALVIAGAEVARAIQTPASLPYRRHPHHLLAENEFAPPPQAWHTGA